MDVRGLAPAAQDDEGTSVVDLFIDRDALASTRTTLENIRETLGGAASDMAAVPSDITGSAMLQERLATFGSDWNHGIDKLAEVSGNGAAGLASIAEAFSTADAELATALEPPPPGGPAQGPVAL